MHDQSTWAPALGGQPASPITGREPEISGLRAYLPPLIVHVDDDPDLLMLVRHVLLAVGDFRVESFKHGQDALDFCLARRPALIMTDLMRPGLDGAALCRLIRTEPDLEGLPIVIFSACTPHALRPIMHLDVTFLSKPCTWQEILSTVELCLEA